MLKSSTQSDEDRKAQLKISRRLKKEWLESTIEDCFRLLHNREEIVSAVVVTLDKNRMQLRASVNEGKVLVSVGDGIVSLQNRIWNRGQLESAISWILGYVDGYRQ